MARGRPHWAEILGLVLRWGAVGAVGLVLLVALYLLVVIAGAALGLWPISAR